MNLAATGTYTVEVEPAGQQTMSFSLTASQDLTCTLALNTPQSVNLASPGQNALLSFTATAGETVALSIGSISTIPSGQSVVVYVYNSSGSEVSGMGATTGQTLNLTNLAVGTYNILVEPYFAATGTMQLTLASGVTGAIQLNGSTTQYATTVPNQYGYFTFSGTAGESIGLGLTSLVLSPSTQYVALDVYEPNGSSLNNVYCYISTTGCQLSLMNLPVTGTYTVEVEPAGQQTMSFSLTASQDLTGTLALNTPESVNLTSPGQNAMLTFTATAGETVALSIGSISTTPSGQDVLVYVYNSSGSEVSSMGTSTGQTLNLANLAAGTYNVLIEPYYAATGTMQLALASGVTGAIQLNGSTAQYATTVPNQYGYFTFSGTAGESIGLGLTNLVLSPSTQYVALDVYEPNGSYLNNVYCYTSTVGCQLSLMNLPVTGTYTVEVEPAGQQTMSFSLTASQDLAGTLALNTPQSMNLASPGQNASLSFTATAGETVALSIGSISTTPSGQDVLVYVYNSSGSEVSGMGTSTGQTLNLTNLAAGTYNVLVEPYFAATGAMQLTLASGVTGAIQLDGSTAQYATTVPNQYGYFTFSGTAGESIGLGLTNLVLSPSAPYVTLDVSEPNGGSLNNVYCYISTAGCQLSLMNLPVTGTYTVEVAPAGQQTMRFNLTASQDLTGTLALNTPQSVNLASPGQNALLSFTATAGETVALSIGSISTAPSGQTVTVYVYNSSGSEVAGMSTSTGQTLNLANLAAGAYNVLVEPYYAVTGTMQLDLSSN